MKHSSTRIPTPLARLASIGLLVLVLAPSALALGGNLRGPVRGPEHWPEGLTELCNRSERVHGYFVNSTDILFFRGDATAANDFLAAYGQLRGVRLEVVLHPGRLDTGSPWGTEKENLPQSDWRLFASRWNQMPIDTRVDLYLGGRVSFDELRIPARVKVSSSGKLEKRVREHASRQAIEAPAAHESLHQAIEAGDLRTVIRLLLRGAPIDGRRADRQTPLALAAELGDLEIASVLLTRGADPDAKGRRGFVPLVWALENEHRSLARLLVDSTRVDARDEGDETPLFWAAWKTHEAVAKRLLERGADPNARSTKGNTPLMDAVRGRSLEIVKLLLEHGADPKAKDSAGRTARSLTKDQAVWDLLVTHGADE